MYGSKELFADENDEALKSRQIQYDDVAIDRLLNHDYIEEENAAMDDVEEDAFLKAFKVANFEYIDEASKEKEEIQEPKRSNYWEELLKDRYEVHKLKSLILWKRNCLIVKKPYRKKHLLTMLSASSYTRIQEAIQEHIFRTKHGASILPQDKVVIVGTDAIKNFDFSQ
ncbi:unnamed protein product [Lactuca virosa]|uniref:DUF1087 domain-containing protein n=1 Tax=Lactuca virosa TaxID=75947 RepID=A0AAU9P4W5_9ASTR|nr:unnamed protein product [Lactuca virosa]